MSLTADCPADGNASRRPATRRCSRHALPVMMRRVAMVVALSGAALRAGAQTVRRTTADADLTRDPNGVSLLHLARGTALTVGADKNGWFAATVDGWVAASALRDDRRDGYDVSVSVPGGTPMRSNAGTGTTLGTAHQGALFDRVESRGAWVHVKRSGWVPENAFSATGPGATKAPPPPPPPPPPAAAPAASPPARKATETLGAVPHGSATPPAAPASPAPVKAIVTAGSSLSSESGGAPFAATRAPVSGTVVEHQNGWSHLRLDVWVRDGELANGPPSEGITAADLRADPDKYVGQSVEWSVEYLGVETADELRPEIPLGDPYVLARGPLPESGFVYIVISKDQADTFRKLEPLAKIRIQATIRAGKTRFLPTPVLDFTRRLN